MDIANQDKVIVFQGKVLLTEDQVKNNRGHGIRNNQMRISSSNNLGSIDDGPIMIRGEIGVRVSGPSQKPQLDYDNESQPRMIKTFES